MYNISIFLYGLGLRVAALFYGKARLLARGQRDALRQLALSLALRNGRKLIWVHCASLGEFEQGRPIIEQIKAERPETFILLSFFSPSGYEIRKGYAMADCVCYLPLDTRRNARRFVQTAQPNAAVFVKYEFWRNHLTALYRQGVKTYVVSAAFRKQQVFFKPVVGRFFVPTLRRFTKLFVQNGESLQLLAGIGVSNAVAAGDTRFDRVLSVAKNAAALPELEAFAKAGAHTLVAGSTWPPDELLIAELVNANPDMRLIIAPHELGESRVQSLVALFRRTVMRYSEWKENKSADLGACQVFVVDAIGFLSSLYRFAGTAYVGGGFGVGIHNTLEAAVFGIPVIFGPNCERFNEARDLIARGGAFCISSAADLACTMQLLRSDSNRYTASCKASHDYVEEHKGATEMVMKELRCAM